MQGWEYLTVFVSEHGVVMSINRHEVSPEKTKLPSHEGEWLADFLNRVGAEGWEAVGLAPNKTGGATSGLSSLYVLLKRPLP